MSQDQTMEAQKPYLDVVHILYWLTLGLMHVANATSPPPPLPPVPKPGISTKQWLILANWEHLVTTVTRLHVFRRLSIIPLSHWYSASVQFVITCITITSSYASIPVNQVLTVRSNRARSRIGYTQFLCNDDALMLLSEEPNDSKIRE